tara:strand:+ start:987 stop:1280 length:294 start_codon:yes stop_codon:yes gene_type:complete
MAESRYTFSKKLKDGRLISSASTYKINRAVRSGTIPYSTIILEQGQRLDHIAGAVYGDSTLWWVIAAASGVGWALQCPPGTIIKIPNNAADAFRVIS